MFNKKKGIKEEKIDQLNEVDRKSSSRRLSIPRLLIMVLVILGITYYFFLKIKDVTSEISAVESTPWFAPYVDVTATPQFAFESLGNTNAKDLILSFIVSSEEDPCIPSWGKAYTMDEASTKLDLDRRVARLRQLGGDVAISFGGLLNDELAVKCTDTDRLYDAYKSVIDRYSVNTIDLDIEGEELMILSL
jgi:chitinase